MPSETRPYLAFPAPPNRPARVAVTARATRPLGTPAPPAAADPESTVVLEPADDAAGCGPPGGRPPRRPGSRRLAVLALTGLSVVAPGSLALALCLPARPGSPAVLTGTHSAGPGPDASLPPAAGGMPPGGDGRGAGRLPSPVAARPGTGPGGAATPTG
ncbi:MAG TPA: hypothetical protein VH478_10075, partial [Trebonia sp.]|nr:hypothetical protein [Trebonia sp.]